MSFVRAPNPIWYLPDQEGEPLNDEYYLFTLTNTLPYVPQNVYRDNQGQTVWTGDIVRFLPNGTLPNNLYWDPNLVYRLEVRHGNTQFDPLTYEVNDFVPDQGQSIITETSILTNENQITNPTFSQVSFSQPPGQSEPTMTITSAGTYQIAPGWELILTGAGTTTLTQVVWSADQNTGGMTPNPVPAYALNINNAGWTSAILQQRFNKNGGIWTNGAVAMSFVALAHSSPVLLSMNYVPQIPLASDAGEIINNVTVPVGVYETFSGAGNLGQSSNNNLNNVSYVDIEIVLPGTGNLDISNIQVVGQSTPLDDPDTAPLPSFQQITEERMTDHLFHLYKDDLITKPRKSLLAGWDFSLNPYQFNDTAITAQTSQTVYIADQTILYQETNNNISTGQASAADRYGLQVQPTAASTNTRFALIQYIDAATIKPYWSNIVSTMVRARIGTSVNTQVGLKMRLIWRTSLPSAIGAAEPILSWTLGGDPVFTAAWTAITPENDPEYTLEDLFTGFPFNNMLLPDDSSANMTLGIVVYTMDRMAVSMGDFIVFDKISLIPCQFACDAHPQTYNEALADCQYYWRKSYDKGALPGTVSQGGGTSIITTAAYTAPFIYYSERFNNMRASNYTVTFYSSQTGTAGKIHNATAGVDLDADTVTQSDTAFTVRLNTNVAAANSRLVVQYTVDARLGI